VKEDGCVETSSTLQHWLAWCAILRLPPLWLLNIATSVAGAGSLAVILQPAFVPFGGAVEYLLFLCLCLCLVVLPELPEHLPIDPAADVEHCIGCSWLHLAASFCVCHVSFELLECLYLIAVEEFAVLDE
jgi:hypothetical protein